MSGSTPDLILLGRLLRAVMDWDAKEQGSAISGQHLRAVSNQRLAISSGQALVIEEDVEEEVEGVRQS